MLLILLVMAVIVVVFLCIFENTTISLSPVEANESGLVGQFAEAIETFSVEGKVMVMGELWKATASRGIIEKGERVKVVSVEAELVLVVEKITDLTSG